MKQTLEFSSRAENLAMVRKFVRQFLTCTSLTGCEAEMLVLGVDEACSNIIRHAYQNHTESKPIILCCERLRKQVRFKLRDFGDQIDPQKLNGRPIERIEPGGLGLYLMRRAFDEVDYTLKEAGTELVLTKRV